MAAGGQTAAATPPLNPEQRERLRRELGACLSEGEKLGPLCSFKIGGQADFFLQPRDLPELEKVLAVLTAAAIPWLLLGGGSNLLIADEGIRGHVVICLGAGFSSLAEVGGDDNFVLLQAGAALPLAGLLDFAARREAAGLENLAGIPGRLGGALIMNAGAWGATIFDYLAAVQLFGAAGPEWKRAAELDPAYRDGGIPAGRIVTGSYFLLPRAPGKRDPSTDAGSVEPAPGSARFERRFGFPQSACSRGRPSIR